MSEKCLGVFYDFDSESGPNIKKVLRNGQDSLTSVFVFSDAVEFGPTYSSKIKSICEFSNLTKLVVSCDALASRNDLPAPLVVSIELNGKSLYWKSMNLPFAAAKWGPVKLDFNLPVEPIDPEAEIKVYVWNNSKNTFLIDNFSVGFFSGGGESQTYGFYPERYVHMDFDTPSHVDTSNNTTHAPQADTDGSYELNFFQSFSPVVSRRVGAVSDGPLVYIMTRAEINPAFDNPSICFAVSLSDSMGNEYFFQTRINDKPHKAGEWTSAKAKMELPHERIKPNDIISVYVWNRGFQNVLLDDFVVQFGESNKRVGRKSAIDMQGYGERGYDFKTNQPPFRKRTLDGFSVSEISGLSTAWANEFAKTPINAFDKMCVGKFGAGQSTTSQIALFRKEQMFFFGFCVKDSSFMCYATASTSIMKGFDVEQATFISADLNGDGMDEVIAHQSGSNKLHILKPDGKTNIIDCGKNSKSNAPDLVNITDVSLGDFSKGQSFKLYTAGDFLGDEKVELLFVDKQTGAFNVYDSSGQLVSNGQSGKFKSNMSDGFLVQAVNLKSANKKSGLAIRENEISEFEFYVLNNIGSELINQKILNSDLLLFTGCDDVKVVDGMNSSIWYFHRTVPRFGFFEVSQSDDLGLEILYEFDFNRINGAFNPKYYEQRQLLYGDFTGSGKLELLLIASNCLDGNFGGYQCQSPMITGDFPPVCQIFKIN
ncbi:MAG: FG-GAP repeat domain-containing protein [Bacteroidota bacterium]